jgi:hypothetical protein
VQDALQLYKDTARSCGFDVIVDSRVANVHKPINFSQAYSAMYRPIDSARYLEKKLLDEAGIVITHLDDKRVSVTYNDALPIKNVTK